jgi:hypothetical protein
MSTLPAVTLPTVEELEATFGGVWSPDPWGHSMIAVFGPFELHLRLDRSLTGYQFAIAKARGLDFGYRTFGKDWRAIGLATLAAFHAGAAQLPKGAP